MKRGLALVIAGGLTLGLAANARAQVAVGVNPWGGVGVSVGNPYGYYSSGYSGLGGVGYMPGATVYSSGYYGVAPMAYGSPMIYRSYSYYPAYGGYYGGFGPMRRGWFGPRRYGFW